MNSDGHCGRIQWSLVSTTAVGSCQAGIQPTLAILRTQLPVLANTARSRVYRRHPSAHQRNWQPPMQRPSPFSLRPVPSRLSQPGHSIRPANLSADLTRRSESHCTQPVCSTGGGIQALWRIRVQSSMNAPRMSAPCKPGWHPLISLPSASSQVGSHRP
jgi:hypothetical protein